MRAALQSASYSADRVRLLSAPEGSRDWALGMRYEIQVSAAQPGADPEYIRHCLIALRCSGGWRLLQTSRDTPFRSFHQFCLAPLPHGLGLTRGQVEGFLRLPVRPSGKGMDRPSSRALDLVKQACLELRPAERADLLRWLVDFDD
jgi:hypothetical protein